MEKSTNKMKIAGYLCYVFAAVLSLLAIVKAVESSIALPLVQTWLTAGTGLLFGNSAKRIVGENVKSKNEALKKEQ